MTIEVVNGQRKEIWYILYHGYGWCETYGPSMTDMASYYTINQLLQLERDEKIAEFEKQLAKQIGSFHNLLIGVLFKIIQESKKGKKE